MKRALTVLLGMQVKRCEALEEEELKTLCEYVRPGCAVAKAGC